MNHVEGDLILDTSEENRAENRTRRTQTPLTLNEKREQKVPSERNDRDQIITNVNVIFL